MMTTFIFFLQNYPYPMESSSNPQKEKRDFSFFVDYVIFLIDA